MVVMSLILNILWLVLGGGLLGGAAWILVGILCALSIVGLPWARSVQHLVGRFYVIEIAW